MLYTSCIVADDNEVSGKHASIINGKLQDLGSTNGTTVDDVRLEPYTDIILAEGQKICIGNTTFDVSN